jgi:hypothetical protein
VQEVKIVMVELMSWAMSLPSAQATVAFAPLQFKIQARLKKGSLRSSEVRR